MSLDHLRAFAATDVDPRDPAHLAPLLDTARTLEEQLRREARDGAAPEVVLLGGIASGKYPDPLARVFGPRLRVPSAFVGRGDVSRGGLMLRVVEAGEELEYVPALDTERRGPRPPSLNPGPRPGSS